MDDQYNYRVAILIVSFRNPGDVCSCLAALSRMSTDTTFDVFICENGGRDAFHELCANLLDPEGPCTIATHVSTSLISANERLVEIRCMALKGRTSRVWIGLAAQNVGYAGGLNNWIECLMHIPGWEGLWILNPDTQPEPGALNALVERAFVGKKGMVGSSIVPLDDRERIHCRGGHRWRKFMTKLGIIGFREHVSDAIDIQAIEAMLDSISGSSMYITRACLEEIGPMDEQYHLYYEDADWSVRAKGHGLGYAKDSIVPHKGGTTIGSASGRANRSQLSVYLESRNRILFVRKHSRPFFVVACVLGLFYSLEYLFVGSPGNFKAALKGLIAGIASETGPPPEAARKSLGM